MLTRRGGCVHDAAQWSHSQVVLLIPYLLVRRHCSISHGSLALGLSYCSHDGAEADALIEGWQRNGLIQLLPAYHADQHEVLN